MVPILVSLCSSSGKVCHLLAAAVGEAFVALSGLGAQPHRHKWAT